MDVYLVKMNIVLYKLFLDVILLNVTLEFEVMNFLK